ncbi:MAG: HEAT repeat domain-containing protein [Deltaproteobacteria bacterium]|nr:HEAT repeat domain-containing protein [Deltaproteobacteria bacterium]
MSEAAQIIHLLKRGSVEQKEEAVKAASLYVYDRDYFPEALPLLMELLELETTPKIAEEAAWALWKFKDPKAVPVLLKKSKEAKTIGVREKAIRALGLLEATEALPYLRELAFGKKEPVFLKAGAIAALGFFKDADLVPPLFKQIKSRDFLVSKEALHALERFLRRDPKGFPLKILKKMKRFETKKSFWRFFWPI